MIKFSPANSSPEILQARGALTCDNAEESWAYLSKWLNTNPKGLVDVTELDSVDATGMRVLLMCEQLRHGSVLGADQSTVLRQVIAAAA